TFREQLIGCLAGASAIALSERERSWLGQIADQMAIGLRSIQQFTQLKALSDELSDRSRRIELQNVELAETSRLKSDFLSSMSHELRTPLNAIIGFSELLKDGLLGELPSEQLDYTTEIYNAGTHLLSLINDILDLSKIEAGKMDLDVESVELGPLVENSIGIVKGLASTNGVELKTHMDPSVTTIEADARKLRQIIYNLLSNAVKFTPHGGHVAVEVIARGSNVEIAVTDTGIGIPQESLGQIFNAFEQLDSGISRSFEGTGLGLQMVRSLAELHGGEACVSSEVGRGSRFWVRLPQSQADRALSDRAPSDMAPSDTAPSDTAPSDMVPSEEFPHAGVESSSAPGAILVVEPDTRQAEVIRESLVRIGLTAVITTDTVAAQERARDQSFDALVVDVETCVSEQGLSFLVARDSNVELSDLPLIVLSTSKNDPTAVDLRATCVVPKPVAGDEMVAALRSLGLDSVGEQSRSTALVVDDDPRAVSYVCRVLEAAGMTTERAFGGQQALEAIAGSNFDVVVLDLMMPEVSGFDVLFQLRADPITHDLPVLVLTAKSLTASERASLEQMASAVVAKGRWRGSGFAEVVRDAIDRSKVDPTLGQVRDDTSAVTGRAAVAGESGAHILVLEDQKRERELLQMYLQSSGYRVTVAASAEQATARLGETMPDLVTVDINLPGMDGLTFVELLRKNPRYSELPVLVMSGADEPDQAAGFGASMVLPKPIQRTPFLEAIDNLLGDISRPVPE
ncbi:MAG: response regulator, partial [Mycobacterium sp.]